MKYYVDGLPFKNGYTDCTLQGYNNILNYYGMNISDNMCFGLGEGITFKFKRVKIGSNIPIVMIIGKCLDSEKIATKKSGIMLEEFTNDDYLREVKNRRPIIMYTGATRCNMKSIA